MRRTYVTFLHSQTLELLRLSRPKK